MRRTPDARRAVPARQRGDVLVEFAIVSTVTLMLILGIVDFARALYTYHLVSNGARAGSRYAMVRGSTCTVAGCPATTDSVQNYVRGLAPAIDPTQLTVSTTWIAGNGPCDGSPYQSPGCTVSVQVTYPFNFIVPLLPNFTMSMSSTSQMIIAQ